jgi:hypothetical protein
MLTSMLARQSTRTKTKTEMKKITKQEKTLAGLATPVPPTKQMRTAIALILVLEHSRQTQYR